MYTDIAWSDSNSWNSVNGNTFVFKIDGELDGHFNIKKKIEIEYKNIITVYPYTKFDRAYRNSGGEVFHANDRVFNVGTPQAILKNKQ